MVTRSRVISMEALCFQELRRYQRSELARRLGAKADSIISRLVAANILRGVKSSSGAIESADMLDIMVEPASTLVFNFCGVLLIDDLLIRCLPKYMQLENGQFSRDSFSLLLQALERYDRARRTRITRAGSASDGSMLGIIRALLHDYHENGLYRITTNRLEINGAGETDWDSTIMLHDPFFTSAGEPIYIERETQRAKTDSDSFFRLLQMAVLQECASIIRTLELDSLIPVAGINFPGHTIERLGSRHHILAQLRREYAAQFSSQRRDTLLLLTMYLERKSGRGASPICFFGTSAMPRLWEVAIATVLDSQLQRPIADIEALSPALRHSYPDRDRRLIDIIDRPLWTLKDGRQFMTSTLIPDTIAIYADSFIIYDAKYYTPQASTTLYGQPGLESVTKQYLYHLAYRDFISYFGLKHVRNIFLIPREHTPEAPVTNSFATTRLELLSRYTSTDIETLSIDADAVWQAYIDGRSLIASK